MNEPLTPRRIVRFGIFEVDLASGELRKNGLKIRLSGQPFQILGMLLEKPGQVVTREELQKKLWPDGTFVDFDHSLNTAINKIREALGDSAENPRFVETLARRGYRLIAPVELVMSGVPLLEPALGSAEPRDLASAVDAASLSPPATVPAKEAVPAAYWRASKVAVWVSVGALLVAALAFGFWWVSRRVSEPPGVLKLTRLTSDAGLTMEPAISPDGKLVAYASDRSGEGNLDIWLKQVSGGEPIRLTRDPADDHQPCFSSDGSQIVFRSEREGGGLYRIPTLGGGDERLLAASGRDPRFSPDGSRVVYWVGIAGIQQELLVGSRLFVVASTGGTPREIRTGFARASSPIWSPDGSHVLFTGTPVVAADEFPAFWPMDWWVAPVDGGTPVKTGAFDALARQDIAVRWPALTPVASQWVDDRIFFYAQLAGTINLWQVTTSPDTYQVTGAAQRLTSGAGMEIQPSIAKGQTVVFSSLVPNEDIWSLPLDAKRGEVTGALQQLTSEMAQDSMPSISTDGSTVAFVSDRSGNPEIWVRATATRRARPLTLTPSPEVHPEISPDGTLVAYHTDPAWPNSQGLQVMPTAGGIPKTVCQSCGWAMDWSPDSRYLIVKDAPKNPRALFLLNVMSGKSTLLLNHSISHLYQANFSPEGRWIAFEAALPGSRLFIAPFHGEESVPPVQWIALGDGSSWDDKPRWSPDGNLLYFISDRDGFLCLWAQRLDAATKQPVGPAFNVYHFHEARRSMTNTDLGSLEMSVARDKIVFNLGELTGNLWMTKLDLK